MWDAQAGGDEARVKLCERQPAADLHQFTRQTLLHLDFRPDVDEDVVE
jgi:hypothetical protein